jgi:hypothetical protein
MSDDGMSPSKTIPSMVSPSVSNMPGITQLALIPAAASSRRRVSKAASNPRLDAE